MSEHIKTCNNILVIKPALKADMGVTSYDTITSLLCS